MMSQSGATENRKVKTLRGMGASPGYACGTLFVYRPLTLADVCERPILVTETDAECTRFETALRAARDELIMLQQQVVADIGEEQAGIFGAHIAMLEDVGLLKHIAQWIRDNKICAEAALAIEVQRSLRLLKAAACEYIRERATDVVDVGNRVLRHLCADDRYASLMDLPPDTIIAAGELLPSDTVRMDKKNVVGLATEGGGPTSHTAILARSLGVPAVSGVTGLLEAATGVKDRVLLDGVRGTLILSPSTGQTQCFVRRHRKFRQAVTLLRLDEPKACRLKDGSPVTLLANLNLAEEVDCVREHNLEGVGLFRTEMMYLLESVPPTLAMQRRHYGQVAEGCLKGPVTIRTFDFADDKRPLFMNHPDDGQYPRGVVIPPQQDRLLKTQLHAIVRSARRYPNLRILFPMIRDWHDLKARVDLVRSISESEEMETKIAVGAMIETPAAVFLLPEIVDLVDYICIGCNDLAHFTLAEDRSLGTRSVRDYAMHPAVLRTIQQVVSVAEKRNCRVCVCGEAASDPLLATVLVGLGIRELSVCPPQAAEVRYALRHVRSSVATKLAAAALQADSRCSREEMKALMPAVLKAVES